MIILNRTLKLLRQQSSVTLLKAGNRNLRPQSRQIIYIEDEYCPSVNDYIQANLEKIRHDMKCAGFELVYMPAVSISPEEARYWNHGAIQKGLGTTVLFRNLQLEGYKGHLPALLLNTGRKADRQKFWALPINKQDPAQAFSILDDAFQQAWNMDTFISEESPAICSIDTEIPSEPCWSPHEHAIFLHHFESSVVAAPKSIDDLSQEDKDTYDEIKRRIAELRKRGIPDSILGSLLIDDVTPRTIRITRDFRILFEDTGEEIKLVTMDKVLYLLLLRHPEGIAQKCMTDYIAEMEHIYMAMHQGFLQDRYRTAISLLAFDSKSCNSHLSRIRKCITVQVGGALAEYYIPNSGRGAVRRIPLDAKYIVWEE